MAALGWHGGPETDNIRTSAPSDCSLRSLLYLLRSLRLCTSFSFVAFLAFVLTCILSRLQIKLIRL